jgi:eukaryotic-like serine/threonine-protein kinase
MTQTAAVVGTAQYLSPEQARGETVDSRSDVYSTGCLLYELLTGRPPFIGDSPVAVAYQHVREQPAPPSDHDQELDPEIDAIVLKSLAKRVEDRYQSAAAMRQDIERYLAGHPIQATPAPVAATTVAPAVAGATTTLPATAAAPPPGEDRQRGRTGLLLLLGLLIIAAIAGAAYLLPSMFEEDVQRSAVPALVGLTEDDARLAIGDAGLTVGQVTREPDEDVPADEVIRQDPNRDVYVDPGTAVDLVVSLGKPEVQVPYVVGQPRLAARDALRAAGLKVAFTEVESDEPKGQVISTDPAAGQSVAEGTTITLSVSDGPETVPDVRGRKQGDAPRVLQQAGFQVEVRTDAASTEPKGTVVDQFPSAGGEADRGDTVIIFVSAFVQPPPSPSPTETPTPTPTPTETPTTPVPPTTPTEVPPTPPTTPGQQRRTP